MKIDGKDVIVTWGADHLTGHDAATGKLLVGMWRISIRVINGAWRTIASAVVSDGVAVVPYGRGEFLAGVRVGGSGDITKVESDLGEGRSREECGRADADDS